MGQIATVLLWLLDVFRVVLLARIVFDWIRAVNPRFSPKGLVLIVAELSYTLTDWIIKPISKVIKPIRIGGGSLDLSIMAIFVLLIVLESLLLAIR